MIKKYDHKYTYFREKNIFLRLQSRLTDTKFVIPNYNSVWIKKFST
jgi:hypothetical protein